MNTGNWPSSWTRAALELCVLAAVEDLGTTHGYQVARHLAAHGLGEIKGGTLYPVLTRLEEQGLTTTRWVEGLGGPGRKLVEISEAGRAVRRERQDQWDRWTAQVRALLRAGPPATTTASTTDDLVGVVRTDHSPHPAGAPMTSTTTPSTRRYTRDLTMWLQLRDVDGVRIGQLVAEVESHVAESGERPEDAFGPAKTYAAQFGDPKGRWRLRPLTVATTVAAGLGGWLLADGLFRLLTDQDFRGIPAWVLMVTGALVMFLVFLVVPDNSVVDPRRGRPRHPRLALMAGVTALIGGMLGLLWVVVLFLPGV